MTGTYVNPFAGSPGVTRGRIDEGVDYGGSGQIKAIGNAVVAYSGPSPGWPGQYVAYTLTDGPKKGRSVYVAEGVQPAVKVGQRVAAGDVIGSLIPGTSTGIETGWAQSQGYFEPVAQLPGNGDPSGGKPTSAGADFSGFVAGLGGPAGNTPTPGLLGKIVNFGSGAVDTVANATGYGAAEQALSGVEKVPADIASSVVSGLTGMIAPNIERLLLYAVLLAGGAVLAYVGLTRMIGIGATAPLKAAGIAAAL